MKHSHLLLLAIHCNTNESVGTQGCVNAQIIPNGIGLTSIQKKLFIAIPSYNKSINLCDRVS